MARAGALDGSSPQWLQTRESLVALGGATLFAGRSPKWLFADAAARAYVFVNPADDEAPLWLETPDTIVECDAFGFGRVEVDDAAGTVAVEAAGTVGPLRLRAPDLRSLTLNGADVTAMLTPPAPDGVREYNGGD
jgi:hypothetical protein